MITIWHINSKFESKIVYFFIYFVFFSSIHCLFVFGMMADEIVVVMIQTIHIRGRRETCVMVKF